MGRIDWEKDKKRRLVHERGFEPLAATARWNEPPPDPARKAPFAVTLVPGNKKVRRRTATKQAGHAAVPSVKLKQIKLQLLHQVARCELRSLPLPGLSKKQRQALGLAITRAGGVLEWAKEQADYVEIREHQAKKLAKEARMAEVEPASRCTNASGPDIAASIERLAEIQRDLRQLVSRAETELDRVNQEIHRLRQLAAVAREGERGSCT